MPSKSLAIWKTRRQNDLNELELAHESIGGTSRGRRFATQQINQAYAVLLSSQFQGFCRDLHEECIQYFLQGIPEVLVRNSLRSVLLQNRKLETGNPNPGNIGNDYNRIGLPFWDEVKALRKHNSSRQARLENLNLWRNAIAHQSFDSMKIKNGPFLQLRLVRAWRKACDQLAVSFEEVMRQHLQRATGVTPW